MEMEFISLPDVILVGMGFFGDPFKDGRRLERE